MKSETSLKLVQHGDLVARVVITLVHDQTGWSPYISHADMLRLDDVRAALRRGDLAAAAREGEVFTLTKVA